MKNDLEMQLQNDFSFMEQNNTKEERNTYKHFGVECGSGWFDLLHELCTAIKERYAQDNKPVDLVVLQVKQKFGKLRFYYEFEDTPCPIQAFDSLGDGKGIRITPEGGKDEQTIKLRKDIAELVRSAEQKSGTVCEMCGAEGSLQKVSPYYVRTLCADCPRKVSEKKKDTE